MSEGVFTSALDKAEEAAQAETEAGETPDAAPAVAAGPVVNHMPRERRGDDAEMKAAQGSMWLVSFADLFSIMLCFFVLVYATKEPDIEKIAGLSGGTGLYSGAGAQAPGAGQNAAPSINQVDYGEGLDLSYLHSVLRNALAQAGLEGAVSIADGRDHLKLQLRDGQVFSGHALSAPGREVALALGARLNLLSNRITLAVTPEGAGDWMGSMAQAEAFAGAMREGGYRKPFTVTGTGGPGVHKAGVEIRVEADDGRAK